MHTFLLKRLDLNLVFLLLETTLLESTSFPSSPSGRSQHDDIIMGTEVTLAMFAQWLRRFGPMRDTLSKASVLTLPLQETRVPWFCKHMNREAATQTLLTNLTRFSQDAIRSSHLIIVRYSSDPKYHFAITTKPLDKVEHYTVTNSPLGYTISGSPGPVSSPATITSNKGSKGSAVIDNPVIYSPTLLDCIQTCVFDAIFARVLRTQVVLPRDSMDQWEGIFAMATAVLPDDHYKSVNDLNRAVDSIAASQEWGQMRAVNMIRFNSMFVGKEESGGGDDSPVEMSTSIDEISPTINPTSQLGEEVTSPTVSSTHMDGHSSSSSLSSSINNPTQGVNEYHPPPPLPCSSSSVLSQQESAVVGHYMLSQGVQMLIAAGVIDEETGRKIQDLARKNNNN
jgi:hypothetical protein